VHLHSQLLHESDIILVCVVEVVGGIASPATPDLARDLSKGVPNRRALASTVDSSLNLWIMEAD
jgi:hypothetical protein